jgi:DNA polymerase gamma 1
MSDLTLEFEQNQVVDNWLQQTALAEPHIIPLIPQATWKRLFKEGYKDIPDHKLNLLKRQIIEAGLGDVPVDKQVVSLPVPKFSQPLDSWIESPEFQRKYLELAELASDVTLQFDIHNIPDVSTFPGWSMWDVDSSQWSKVSYPITDTLFLDFESYKGNRSDYAPFMCSAISGEGRLYCWLFANELLDQPVVDFGNKIKLYIGHNSVAYDRRYIKQFYEYGHDKRMLDTMSLYFVLMGMSAGQIKTLKALKNFKRENIPAWAKVTCAANLKDIAYHLCGIKLDKDIKDLWVSKEKEAPKPFSNVLNNLNEIWKYAVMDTFSCLRIYAPMYKEIAEIPSKIYLVGQLERSTLRIGNTKSIPEFQAKVNNHNKTKLTELAKLTTELLITNINNRDMPTLRFAQGWIKKDWMERVFKSTSFQDFKSKNLDLFTEDNLTNIQIPVELSFLGWEDDTSDNSKRGVSKRKTLNKLQQVQQAFNKGFVSKIHKRTISDFVSKMHKKPDANSSIPYVSITGKLFPILIGLKWMGNRLEIKQNTWGCYTDKGFIKLPHSKGKENVGTPISKDYKAKVKTKEFTTDLDIDLSTLFETIVETSLWNKFDKRFSALYIHDHIWLVEQVPSGTVTGRMASSLGVVMSNEKKEKAGSEMKTLFGASDPQHLLVAADWDSQESEIFNCHMDSTTGYPISYVFGFILLCYDIHQYVADFLSGQCPIVIERSLAKNMNFANQFFAGIEKLALMAYIALEGQATLVQCLDIAGKFQVFTRGEQEYGKYSNGIASAGFNRIKQLAKNVNQRCKLSGRPISKPLRAEVTSEDLTTRINFNIQGTGQSLVDCFLLILRELATKLGIPYQIAFMIHDQVIVETHKDYVKDMVWLFQICHLCSKAIMYKRFGIHGMPAKKMFFSGIEVDHVLRKSPTSNCITPTNQEPIPLGYAVKPEDCTPTDRILSQLNRVF